MLSYTEKQDGQLLEEGITEAGSMASFTAAGTSYAVHGETTIPFYIYYSMFGFQRTGDFAWAFGDARGRGFLLGATAGRTTLNGEGLQHEDGHSHLLFSTVPNVVAYDPAFAYEVAVIIRDGLKRMYADGEDIFYYLTLYNQDYPMPAMPTGVEDGILRGMYLYRGAVQQAKHRAQLFGSGPMMLRGAARAGDPGAALRRGGRRVERHQLPAAPQRSARRRALEPPPPRRAAARAVRHARARQRRGSGDRHQRLHEGGARHGRALDRRARSCRSAPTASGAATRARRCADTSRWTPSTWWSRRCRRWPSRARCPPGVVARAIQEYGIDPEARDPRLA